MSTENILVVGLCFLWQGVKVMNTFCDSNWNSPYGILKFISYILILFLIEGFKALITHYTNPLNCLQKIIVANILKS